MSNTYVKRCLSFSSIAYMCDSKTFPFTNFSRLTDFRRNRQWSINDTRQSSAAKYRFEGKTVGNFAHKLREKNLFKREVSNEHLRELSVTRHRFSAFWLRSKCSICSYQLNIWYVPYVGTSILNWFLHLGEMLSACTTLATGWPGIAVPPGLAHSPFRERIKLNRRPVFPLNCYTVHTADMTDT